MIWTSIGILILAVATLVVAQRQTNQDIERSYSRGFIEGVETVLKRRYHTLPNEEEQVAKKKD